MRRSDEASVVMQRFGQYFDSFSCSAGASSSHLRGLGAVAELEERLCRHYGFKHALCVASGTTALLALGLALGVKGRRFVAPPLTYGATVAPWLHLGATVSFADVDPDTFTLAPKAVEAIVDAADCAIIAVDLFGTPADSKALREVARRANIPLIVDGAQSFGAWRDGRAAGAFADAVVVSFTAGKALCAGEGGAILTDNEELHQRLLWYCQHPDRQRIELGLHEFNEFGVNGRMHPLAAIWADAGFDAALDRVESRRVEYDRITTALAGDGMIRKMPARLGAVRRSYCRVAVRRRARWSGSGGRRPDALPMLPATWTRATIAELHSSPTFRKEFEGRWLSARPCKIAADVVRDLRFVDDWVREHGSET